MQTNPPDVISATFVLGVVIAILQTLIISIVTWMLKNIIELKEKVTRIDVVLFGEKGSSGMQTHILKFETMTRLLQRIVYRLGTIEDALHIPRNSNVGDSEDTDLDDVK